MDPLLVFVRLQLEFLGGDVAILVAILILKHVSYGFLRVLARQEASFALTDLSLDEGGELRRGEPRGGGESVLPEQLCSPWDGPPGGGLPVRTEEGSWCCVLRGAGAEGVPRVRQPWGNGLHVPEAKAGMRGLRHTDPQRGRNMGADRMVDTRCSR